MAVLTPELANPDLDVAGPAGEQARASAADAVRRAKTAEFYTLGFVLGTGYPASPIVVPDNGPAPRSTTSDYHPSAAPGMRLPHLWVDSRISLYDLLGPGLTLLEVGAPPAPAQWKAVAADRGLPWTQLALHRPNTQTLFGARYILTRPDHLVAWRGDKLPAHPETLLDQALGGPASITSRRGAGQTLTEKVTSNL